MPLLGGNSQSVINENIREMKNSGHSEQSSVAASLRNADKFKAKKKVAPKKSADIANDMNGKAKKAKPFTAKKVGGAFKGFGKK